jgi:drug/metabolite transporter (DMT)-like permease
MNSAYLGMLLALTAALSWGGGDFNGGFAARKHSQFQVLLLTTLTSLVTLFLLALLWRENIPSLRDILLASLAGVSGALGLAALYRGLSSGHAALISPVAGVLGAVIPVLTGVILEGLPGSRHVLGFILALIGLWLVSKHEYMTGQRGREGLYIAIIAGLGFGGFLALIAQLETEQVFAPLLIAKAASVVVAMMLLWNTKQPMPSFINSPASILSGLLDAGGNVFYVLATHFARMDIVAMLGSLYPVVTVILSIVFLGERVSRRQWLGVAACIVAIGLLTT